MSVSNDKSGLDKNTASALSYSVGFLSGILFLIIDKRPSVRFHAMQSIVVFGALFVLNTLLGLIGIFSALIPLVSLLIFVLWLLLVYKAWKGEDWEVPILGEYAKKWVVKV